jgi:hypothetical protein
VFQNDARAELRLQELVAKGVENLEELIARRKVVMRLRRVSGSSGIAEADLAFAGGPHQDFSLSAGSGKHYALSRFLPLRRLRQGNGDGNRFKRIAILLDPGLEALQVHGQRSCRVGRSVSELCQRAYAWIAVMRELALFQPSQRRPPVVHQWLGIVGEVAQPHVRIEYCVP